jgi:hypothetical protein
VPSPLPPTPLTHTHTNTPACSVTQLQVDHGARRRGHVAQRALFGGSQGLVTVYLGLSFATFVTLEKPPRIQSPWVPYLSLGERSCPFIGLFPGLHAWYKWEPLVPCLTRLVASKWYLNLDDEMGLFGEVLVKRKKKQTNIVNLVALTLAPHCWKWRRISFWFSVMVYSLGRPWRTAG